MYTEILFPGVLEKLIIPSSTSILNGIFYCVVKDFLAQQQQLLTYHILDAFERFPQVQIVDVTYITLHSADRRGSLKQFMYTLRIVLKTVKLLPTCSDITAYFTKGI